MVQIRNRLIVFLLAATVISMSSVNFLQADAANGTNADPSKGGNQEKAPTIVVFMHVINDNGGTATANDFVIGVTAKNPSPSIFRGSEEGTTVTMSNGLYEVTALPSQGYSMSYSPGCSDRIHTGEDVSCVITANDEPARLVVIKQVINDDGGTAAASDFTMYVGGNNPSPNYFQGSETGTEVEIGPGYYYVGEYYSTGYSQTNSPECSGYINLGETKTCVITNDDIPQAHLTVIANVVNDNEGTAAASDFNIYVYGNDPSPYYFQGSEEGIDVTLFAGYYEVYLSDGPAGYEVITSEECSGFIDGDENKTCTITFDDIPASHLVVVTQVINDDGGSLTASDFTMYVYGNNPSPDYFQGSEEGTDVTIYESWYDVYESWDPNYTSYSEGCHDYIGAGETIACTVTYDDIPPV